MNDLQAFLSISLEQKFNPFRLFGGAKKTLVGEGV